MPEKPQPREKTNNSTLLSKPKTRLIKIIMSVVPIIVVFALVFIFQWLAVYGIIVMSIAFAAYKMYQNREILKTGIASIETAIWGRPFEMLKPGEKRPKVRFVLNKRLAYERDRKAKQDKRRA